MTARRSIVILLVLHVMSCRAQELDPDTLASAESLSWIEDLMMDALPGSSMLVRTGTGGEITGMRLLLDHPSAHGGLLRSATFGEHPLWWVGFRGRTWTLLVGDVTAEAGYGSLLSAARGLGRSRLLPARPLRMLASDVHARSVRGGIGGVRGVAAAFRLDTQMVGRVMIGSSDDAQFLAAWLESRLFGASSCLTFLVRGDTQGIAPALAVAVGKQFGGVEAGCELAVDARLRPVLQACLAVRSTNAPTSLSLWYAPADCDLPMGSVWATSEPMNNTWGAMLRQRVSVRAVATARLSACLYGRPWRSRLLPMASAGVEVIADIEQRVTSRLIAEWRVRHRHDEDGRTDGLRRQLQRHLWSARIRLRRNVTRDLDVRVNIDLRALRHGIEGWSYGTLGWVDACWRAGTSAVLRLRATVFAAESSDVAVAGVEYASQGLQTMVRGLGWGRRVSLGGEWTVPGMAAIALQASAESRIYNGELRNDVRLRISAGLLGAFWGSSRGGALPTDDMRELHE
ncbi:MAG: hypothetical protein FGM33_03750 [Candidatus Kapabacteria bacterium]|nr:hypothetical protein [Candidatus Kapabacteria bacterium]